jgi:hypothetical protein
MGDVMTDRLLHERSAVEGKVRSLEQIAVDETRDLRPEELESIRTYSARLKDIDSQLDVVTQRITLDQDIQDRIALVSNGSAPVGQHQYRSAGELLWDAIRPQDHDARQRYQGVLKRAAQHMGTKAEETVAVAGGFGGLTVSGAQGPVINLLPKGRPWLTAIGVRQAPQAFSFMRPRLVDPDYLTAAQPQALQKQELASKKFDIAADTLKLTTIGNYLNLSLQAEQFVSGSLDITINQLLQRVAVAEEQALAAEVGKTTALVPLAADADAAAMRAAIYDAAALVYTNTGALPEWIAMGPQGWARLGSLVDLAQRPLFPFTNPVNAMGTSSPGQFQIAGLGLTGIVTPGITDGSYYVGNELGVEAYEHRYPVLQAVEPSLLGRQIAVAASLVIYRPTTTEATEVDEALGDGVVKIAPAVAGRADTPAPARR